jgi:hypothetical protein
MKREGEGTIYLAKKTFVIPFCSIPFIFNQRNYSCRRLIGIFVASQRTGQVEEKFHAIKPG